MPAKAVSDPNTIQSSTPAPGLDLILPRQLAAELSMSVRTLQRLHDARTGPPRITLGKHVYYRRAALEQWLARCEGYGGARPAPKLRKSVVSAGRNARRARRTA
jgi:predicted DNA-binding transcriptional regulator AlpA